MFPISLLRHAARLRPEATAGVGPEGRISYRDLVSRADALACAYQQIAGKPHPTIAILGPNCLDMMIAVVAIHAAGGVIVPLNGRNAQPELEAQCDFAKPDLIVLHESYADKISTSGRAVILAGAPGPGSVADCLARHGGKTPAWQADLSDINGLKFTGGSSGRPKGVEQSFRCLMTMIQSVILGLDLGADDRFLCAAPMTHGAGAFLFPILARGGCMVMTSETAPDVLLDLIAAEGITTTWIPPTLLYKLIDAQKAQPRDTSSLRHLIWGGAAASVARLREAGEVFGPVIATAYGQTEAPLIITCGTGPEMAGDKIASVGRVNPLVQVAILDAAGQPLPPGQPGEICVAGDLLMSGYRDMPKETARTLIDGWLHTGDVGLLDDDGFLFIKDRIRDVVITGGFNVYPSDVEAVLSAHPAVAEVVVYGLPDAHWGERLEATAELRPGVQATGAEILAACRAQLGAVKTPKTLHLTDALPRSPVGKVLRREARDQAAALAAGHA